MNELIAGLLGAQVIAIGVVGYLLRENVKDARADLVAISQDALSKFHDHRLKQGENLQTIVNDVKGHVDSVKLHLSALAESGDTEARKRANMARESMVEYMAAFDTAKQEILDELHRIATASGASPQGHTHCVKCGAHVSRYTQIPGIGNVCLNCITELHVDSRREG